MIFLDLRSTWLAVVAITVVAVITVYILLTVGLSVGAMLWAIVASFTLCFQYSHR